MPADSTLAVDEFMPALNHPFKSEIESIRRLILGVRSSLAEGIKWDAPRFRTDEYFAATNLRVKGGVGRVLRLCAKVRDLPANYSIADPTHLLKWLRKDRATVEFSGCRPSATTKWPSRASSANGYVTWMQLDREKFLASVRTCGRMIAVLTAAMASFTGPSSAQSQTPPTPAYPNFEGIWNSATATPLERPARLNGKEFFTREEAAEWERQTAAQNEDPPPHAPSKGVGTYNAVFREPGSKVVKTLRTSIVTDPPDGRIPALTPPAATEKRRRQDLLRHPNGVKDLGLQDQCLVFPTAVPPMIPYSYNSNYQIVQTAEALMIHVEMIHDSRIIPLDNRAHLSPNVRLWLGDSVGRWQGNTLVVDTANFNDGGGFFGDAGGMFGSDRNLHVIERFSLLDANTLLYRFEVDDPTAFTSHWKGELTMARSSGPIYEYACHEGNYALTDLLNGFRANER